MDWKYAEEEAYCNQPERREVVSKRAKLWKDNYKNPKEPVYWELANGDKINIDEMTEQHVKNTLKMIVRRGLLKDKPNAT